MNRAVVGQEVSETIDCTIQGETFDELLDNIYKAVEGYLPVDTQDIVIKQDKHISYAR